MRKLDVLHPGNEKLPFSYLLTSYTVLKTSEQLSQGTKGYYFQLCNYGANDLNYQAMRQEFIKSVNNNDINISLKQAQSISEEMIIEREIWPYFIIMCQGATTYTPEGSTSYNNVNYYMDRRLSIIITTLLMSFEELAGREFITIDNNNLPLFLNILTIFLYQNKQAKEKLLKINDIEEAFNFVNYGIMNLLFNGFDQLVNNKDLAIDFYRIYDKINIEFQEPE